MVEHHAIRVKFSVEAPAWGLFFVKNTKPLGYMAKRGGVFLFSKKIIFPGATTEKSCSQAEKVIGGGATAFPRGYDSEDHGMYT